MPPLTMKDRRSQTIDRILKAATKEFSVAGFAGARVDEIAKSAGVNKATLYYHIGDKQALYAQVVHDLFGNAVEQFNRNITAAQSPQDQLKGFIQTIAGMVDQHPELAAIMLREQASGGKHFPEMVAQDLAQILGILTEILDDGVRSGIFIKTVPLIGHMMIIGAIVFFKMTSPIRAKLAPLVDTFDKTTTNVSGQVAAEIEMLILNAVKKELI
ncbi:MAG: TetR/AcrR family transcriptional regulator [Desulfobacterales bacterium]|nr:TetR/AcrR family transcriptional regulator [Desulfobacterales bacterium]